MAQVSAKAFKVLNQQVGQLNSAVRNIQQAVNSLDALLAGVIKLLDADKVKEATEAVLQEQRKARDDAQEAEVQEAIKTGLLLPAAVTAEDTIIITSDTTADGVTTRGQLVPPHRLPASIAELAYGKKVGDVVEVPESGVKSIIVGVFQINPEKAKPAPAKPALKVVK